MLNRSSNETKPFIGKNKHETKVSAQALTRTEVLHSLETKRTNYLI